MIICSNPSNTLWSTRRGLSSVCSRKGGIGPNSAALATRSEPYVPRYRVTSPVPMEKPTNTMSRRSRTAPAPRTHDGKPDLSGIWQPELNPYRFDVIQDLKDEGIFRSEAEAIF